MNTLKPQYEDSLSLYTCDYKSAIFHYHNGAYGCSVITPLSVYSMAFINECTMQFCGQRLVPILFLCQQLLMYTLVHSKRIYNHY